MRKILFVLLVLPILLFGQNNFTKEDAFIPNKGQFDGRNWQKNKVEYAIHEGNDYVFFTQKGLTYRFDRVIRNPELKGESDFEGEKEGKEERVTKSELVHITWVGSNANVQIIPEQEISSYFSYAIYQDEEHGSVKNINNIKGYKKLVYKNLYNNIDVVYEFHPQGGFKYSFIIHPGADPSKIKMRYSSAHTNIEDENVTYYLDENGELQIKTSLTHVIEHFPFSFYTETKEKIQSKFIFENNILSFELNNYDNTKEIIIDPWVVSETANSSNSSSAVWEVETDDAGNVYTISNEDHMQLKKYNSAGALQWTYNTPWDTASVWIGTLATDNNGVSYVTAGTSPGIERVSTTGSMIWDNGASPGGLGTEFWSITFNCDNTKLIVGGTGGGLIPDEANIYNIDMSNGNCTSYSTVHNGGTGGLAGHPIEVRSIAPTSNSKYIFLTHLHVGAIRDNIGECPNDEPVYKVDNDEELAYKCENYLPETQNGGGLKALIANDNFFYTHTGDKIRKWDITDGTLLATVSVPGGGSNGLGLGLPGIVVHNSGLDVDVSGNVYAGSDGQVVKFDANLNVLQTASVPFTVYDVSVNSNGEVIACGAVQDNSGTNRDGKIAAVDMSAGGQYATVCCDVNICPVDPLCVTDAPINIGVSVSGGTFSGPGITDVNAGTFDPSVAGVGTHTITYSKPCGSETIEITVLSCDPIDVCDDGTNYIASGGSGTITWYDWESFSYSISNEQECIDCPTTTPEYTLGFYTGCSSSTCSGSDWTQIATGTTLDPSTINTWPIMITDGMDTVIYNSASEVPACSACTNPTLSETHVDETCAGDNLGSIDLTITPGSGSSYTSSWSGPSGYTSTSEDISGLAAGTYTVTVTDASNAGCTATITVTIAAGAATDDASFTVSDFCEGATNSATITGTTGGTFTFNPAPTNGETINGITGAISNGVGGTSYTIEYTTNGTCPASSTQSLTVNANPISSITGSLTFCSGGSTTLDAGAGYTTYAWSPSGSTQTISVNTAGTYIVTVTDANGCQGTDQVDVTIATGLSPTITGVLSICSGAATTLDAGAGYATYTWSPSGNTQTISVTTGGTYSVTVTDASGCSGSDQVTVTENNNPTPSISGSTSFCTGGSSVLDAGAGYTTYAWSPSGSTQTISVNTAGTYVVTVTDANGCQGTDQVDVTIAAGLSPTITGVMAICSGASTTLDAGAGYATYAWSPSGSTQTITVTQGGTYSVTVTDASGCSGSDQVTVTENINPTPTITGALSFCTGNSTTLDAGAGYSTYTWNPSGTSQTLNVTTGGTYSVIVSDANGCMGGDQVTVTEAASLTPQITGNLTYCEGSSTTLDAGNGYAIYAWTPSGSNQTITATAGTYVVTVTDASGCSGTDQVTVSEIANPTPTITGNLAYCPGSSTTLDAGAGYVSYAWSPSGSGQTISVNSPNTYSVVVTDANGCSGTTSVNVAENPPVTPTITGNTSICAGNNASLDAGAGYSAYAWSTGATTQVTNVNVAGNYSVTVTDANGCTGSDGITVEVNELTINTTGNQTICYGTSTDVTANVFLGGNPPYVYTWSTGETGTTITVSPTSQTIISVYATDNMGCVSQTEYVTINVTDPVEFQVYANTDSVCPGDHVLITSSINNGTPPYTITDEFGTVVTNPSTEYINDQTTFNYTVTDACGSTASDIVTVNVYPVPALSFSADVLNGCQPLTVNFVETSASGTGYTYIWSFGDNSDNNLSFSQNATHVFENAGIFDVGVSVITDKGCKNSLVIDNLIEVYKKPEAMFVANPDYVTIINPVVDFTNYSQYAESYVWSFGDGDSSNIVSPAHSYFNIQDYLVKLIAISKDGCKDTVLHKIIVDDIFTLYVPTAFSPDNDGINDLFLAKGHGIDLDYFNLKVYDRWGEIIFETDDIFEGWDGKYPRRDDFVKSDTYTWLVTFKTFTGVEYQKTGKVTVIR